MRSKALILLRQANFTSLKSAMGNFFLAALKYAAFSLTGSPAMKAEAVHSFNDGSAQVSVFMGSIFAGMPPSAAFPNGFGRLSNLIVLFVAIFMAYNAVHTIELGFQAILFPHPTSGIYWSLTVLALSLAVDGYILFQAMKDIGRAAGLPKIRGWGLVRLSMDKYHLASPETRLVFFEDLLATGAILIAAAGILAAYLGIAAWGDGLAGLIIGLMLLGIALSIAWENIKGLIGYTAPKEVVNEIAETIMSVDGVEDLYDLDVVKEGSFLDVDGTIELDDLLTVREAEDIKDEVKRRIQKAYPNIHNLTLGIHEDDCLSRWGSRDYHRLRRKKVCIGMEKQQLRRWFSLRRKAGMEQGMSKV